MKRNFRGEASTSEELKQFKGYRTYADILEDELEQERALQKSENEGVEDEGGNKDFKWYVNGLRKISKLKKGGAALTEIHLWHEFLAHLKAYEDLQRLLVSDPNNTDDIAKAIKNIRDLYFRAYFEAGMRYRAMRIIGRTDDLQREILEIKKTELRFGRKFLRLPDYRVTGQAGQIMTLYHLAPRSLVENIVRQGIVPGFISGMTDKAFVYADIKPRPEWLDAGGISEYQRGGEIYGDFVVCEIKITPDVEAYMWLEYFSRIGEREEIISCWNSCLLSSKVIPLEQQIATKQKILGDSFDDFEHSEVLLDFVPPKNIHILE